MVQQEYSIRRATLDDAAALAQVHEATWRETYAGLVSDELLAALTADARTEVWRLNLSGQGERLATTYVAEGGGQLVAFASCGQQRDADLAAQGYAGELSPVYVLGAAQRRGLGTGVMRAMMRDLDDRGLVGFTLWVLRDNIPARSLYEELGGRLIGQRTQERTNGTLAEVAYGWAAS